MGTTRGKDVSYQCADDCKQSGCPGHVMRMDYSRVSDIRSFYIDDEHWFSCDDDMWAAMLKAEENCG
jgi:hypothetical protein